MKWFAVVFLSAAVVLAVLGLKWHGLWWGAVPVAVIACVGLLSAAGAQEGEEPAHDLGGAQDPQAHPHPLHG